MKESYIKRININQDQAETLRMERINTQAKKSRSLTRVISFTSGKGGVGKTNTVVNVATGLSELGRSVLILDADLGLANVDVMLGLRSEYTLHDVVEGRRRMDEIMLSGPSGITVIPAASGVESICNLDHEKRLTLMHAIEEVALNYDYLLIDTRAGISSDVMHFNSAANEIVCVITSEPTSLTDAYALIKVLAKNYNEKSISILANNINSSARPLEQEALAAFKRLQNSVDKFLSREQVDLKYLGYIPADILVSEAVRSQKAVSALYPSSSVGMAFRRLSEKIDFDFTQYRMKGGMQFFFKQLMEMEAYGG